MRTHAYRDSILETMDGVALAAWTPFIGLFKSVTDLRAGTVVEADYTGYGVRPSASFGAVANTSPIGGRQKANDVAVAFPQNTGASQDVIGWFTNTASGAGITRDIGFLDADPPILGTAEDTGELIRAPAHGLSTDQRVLVLASPGALLPVGLSENVAYFVLAAGLTADDFALSTTSGGAAVNITAKGAAMFMPYTARTIAGGATPDIAIGAIVIQD